MEEVVFLIMILFLAAGILYQAITISALEDLVRDLVDTNRQLAMQKKEKE